MRSLLKLGPKGQSIALVGEKVLQKGQLVVRAQDWSEGLIVHIADVFVLYASLVTVTSKNFSFSRLIVFGVLANRLLERNLPEAWVCGLSRKISLFVDLKVENGSGCESHILN